MHKTLYFKDTKVGFMWYNASLMLNKSNPVGLVLEVQVKTNTRGKKLYFVDYIIMYEGKIERRRTISGTANEPFLNFAYNDDLLMDWSRDSG